MAWFYSGYNIPGLPDGDDVGEEHNEAEQVAEPGSDETLQSHHDDR